MRKLIKCLLAGVIGALILCASAYAAPSLKCDPQSGVTSYQLVGPIWAPSVVAAQPDGSILMDVSGANVGENSFTVKACLTDAIWGELCSDAVPFVFIRPAPPVTTKAIRLIQYGRSGG